MMGRETVREGRETVREGRETVRDERETVREGRETVREGLWRESREANFRATVLRSFHRKRKSLALSVDCAF